MNFACLQRPCFRAGHGLKFNRLYTYLPESEGVSSLEKALLLSPFFEIISKSHRISRGILLFGQEGLWEILGGAGLSIMDSFVVERFAQVRSDLLKTISGFPEDKAEEAVCGNWNIQGVLAHIAGWDTYFAMTVRRLRMGEAVPYWGDHPQWGEDMEKRNEALVKEREGRIWEEIHDEFVKAGEEFFKEYRNLEEGLWDQRFWGQRKPTPAWVLKHNVEHYEEHRKEIEKKLKEGERK